MYMRSFDDSSQYLDYNFETKEFRSHEDGPLELIADLHVSGVYTQDGNYADAIYRHLGRLYLEIDCKRIIVDENVSALIKRVDKKKNRIMIKKADIVVLEKEYYRPRGFSGIFDFTATNMEDYDFYVFIYNILADRERSERIFR